MMRQAGVTIDKLAGHAFLKNHHNVALGVLLGNFDAGAVKEDVFDEYRQQGLKTLKKTPPISEHLFVVRKTLPPETDKKIPIGAQEKEYTKVILSETSRLERILTSVLTFTKEPSPHREKNYINEVIDESLQLFTISFKEKSIDVRKSFADLPPILMDRDQVRGVLDNLLSNAIYATPAEGKITITTDKKYFGATPYVTVKIADTGPGIAEDIRSTIFEPFFTTKPVGPDHGIGLGLSISRKIMEEHGGRIRVESKIEEGATFSLFFPYPIHQKY